MAMSSYPSSSLNPSSSMQHQQQQYQAQQQQQHHFHQHGSSSSTSALDLDLGALSLSDEHHYQQHPASSHQAQSRAYTSSQQRSYQDAPSPHLSHHQQQMNSANSFHPHHQSTHSFSSGEDHSSRRQQSSQPVQFQPSPYGASNAPPHHPLHQTHKLDTPRRRGVVKFFNSLKGFGFVVDNDSTALGGQEVFCHFSAISGKGGFRSLAEGEEVEYELVQGPKGFQAANLTGPQGRTVVGDPKARLPKPPPFMPFAPMLGTQFLQGDAYSQQFAASPYTQHVVYVPTSVLPPGQYGSSPYIANGGGAAPLASTREGRHGSSPFGPNYQFSPPGPISGAPGPGSTTSGISPSRAGGPGSDSDRYSSSLSAQASYPSSRGGPSGSTTSFGTSVPSTYGGTQRGHEQGEGAPNPNKNAGSTNLNSLSFGFAPFSPPAGTSLNLFDEAVRAPRSDTGSLGRPLSRGNELVHASNGGSSGSAGAFDALRQQPIGNAARSNTPGSRSTPLGNGSLSGGDWKSSYNSGSNGGGAEL